MYKRQAPGYLEAMGLDHYEYQCGRGVKVSDKIAFALKDKAKEHNITLSLHAPYFISLSSLEAEKRDNSINYILQSCDAASRMGADRIVIHSGSCAKISREDALKLAKDTLTRARKAAVEQGFEHIVFCPETMGKVNQLGNLTEVLELCKLDDTFLPTIDFGHLNAREFGYIKGKAEYEKMLDETKAKLESYETDVKNKYIGIIEQYKAKFDTTFRTVGFTVYETRKEAAAQRALNFAKSVIPKGYTEQDLIDARQKVDEFLLTVGITFEEAEQVSELFRQCYLNVNTVDGIAFNSKEEAEAARAELAEITAIMSDVPKPNPDLLLDYEQKLFDVKAKLESYKTPVKDKYIAIIDDYITKFDTTFKTTGAFSKAETRQQAAQIRALKLVKSIAPTGCTYDDVDKAIKALDDTLPKLGIDKTLATDATDYIQAQEDKLNTVDGVVLPDRENAALAKKELEEIQNIMFKVAPPQNEPLLSYERNLLEIEDKLSQLRTLVKDKYIGIIKKHLVDFDEKFRKVSLIKTAATREEAAKERALKFVKSKTYNTVTDVNNVRNELAELLPELGITSEQATEANEYLTNTENKLNGTAPQSKLKGVFGMFKK